MTFSITIKLKTSPAERTPWAGFQSYFPAITRARLRFAQLRRAVDGISQKVLTNTLRGLERDGLVTRRIYASVPPRVEYSLTDLGRSLSGLVERICDWAEANIEQVQDARAIYDRAGEETGLSA